MRQRTVLHRKGWEKLRGLFHPDITKTACQQGLCPFCSFFKSEISNCIYSQSKLKKKKKKDPTRPQPEQTEVKAITNSLPSSSQGTPSKTSQKRIQLINGIYLQSGISQIFLKTKYQHDLIKIYSTSYTINTVFLAILI